MMISNLKHIKMIKRRCIHLRYISTPRKIISFSSPVLGDEEIQSVSSVIMGGRMVMGPKVSEFESMVAGLCGQKHAVAVTSGTTALTLSMAAYNIDSKWVAVVPAYTWVATYNAPKMLGTETRIADINPFSYCMDPKRAEEQRNKSMKDKAIAIPVHLFGQKCPTPKRKFDVILGDGCCAFAGVDSEMKTCGSWNPVECFSFHPRKLITTGEGGMIVCSDDQYAQQLRLLRDHGAYRTPEQRKQTTAGGDMIPEFPVAGYNFRMTELQGALGVAQMKRLPQIIDIRVAISDIYDQQLSDGMTDMMTPLSYVNTPLSTRNDIYIQLPQKANEITPLSKRVLTMYPIQISSNVLYNLYNEVSNCTDLHTLEALGYRIVDEVQTLKSIKLHIMNELVKLGITVRPPMICLLDVAHVQDDHLAYTGQDLKQDRIKAMHFPGAYITSNLTFALPLHPLMTLDDAERVVNCVRTVTSNATSFMSRAISASSLHYSDFTLQYPVRREYFTSNFRLPDPSCNVTTSKNSVDKDQNYTNSAVNTNKSVSHLLENNLKSFQNGNLLPNPRELMRNREFGLYIHIPFCASKCNYCNFAVDTRQSEEVHRSYVTTLAALTEAWVNHIMESKNNLDINGIDIGGGTPTHLRESHLDAVLAPLQPLLQAPSILNNRNRSNFVSIETTPLIAATELSKLKLLVDRGVYRVSVGIQSTSSSMLAKVNRINQVNMEAAGMQNLKDAGFKRISTDIIFGLPGQTMDDWKNDLRNVVELKPDCITTYDCLYRGKGRSIKRSQEIPLCETYGKMYDYSYEFLTSNGYFASYGSLNFSRRQDETGTSSYFENRLLHGKSYLGLGNYASSLIDSYWLFAPYSVNGFVNTLSTPNNILRDDLLSSWPIHDAYRLPLQEIAAKQILLSLSYGQISGSAFLKNFPGYSINDFYGESLDYLVNEVKWLDYDSAKDTYFLRENCFYLLPQIRSLFYSNNALQWYEKNIMKSS